MLGIVLAGFIGSGCEPRSTSSASLTLRGVTMGTTYAVTVVGLATERDGEGLRSVVDAALADVDSKMSTYDDDSEVSRFNRIRGSEWFSVSEDTLHVLEIALSLSRRTDGAFDVTVGPLVDAWGFGPGRSDSWPTPGDVDALRARVGYAALELDPVQPRIRKLNPELEIDLSAVAKGYGVDRVAQVLDEAGFDAYLIEVGGEVRTRGRRPDGRRWRVGIEHPAAGRSGLHRVVELSTAALATSGDYRNYVERDGLRYSHTIDPRTGYPVTHHLASVSVIDASCAVADAQATALEVLGPEKGRALAVSEDWAALFLVRQEDGTFSERTTPAFDEWLNASGGIE